MLTCTRCGGELEPDRLYSLKRNEPVCNICFDETWDKLTAVIEKIIANGDFPDEAGKKEFIYDIRNQFPIDNSLWTMGPGKSLIKTLRDRALDLVEKNRRRELFPGEEELFPTRMELSEKYNTLLKKLLIDQNTGLPFLRVDRESPGDNFFDVSIPEKLEWIFSPTNYNKNIKLWVSKSSMAAGMKFLQIISAICTGISNLIDMRELAKNPSFIISHQALYRSSLEEGTLSKIRRLSLQTLAPVFCTQDYRFSPEDLFHHSLSMIELMKIAAADQWRKLGCNNADFRELLYVMALSLDREKELEKAYFILEKIFHFNQNDSRLSFLKAKIRSIMGDFDLALDNIERALDIEPDKDLFKTGRYMVLENIPIKDPYSSPGCPDITGIYNFLTGEMPDGEKEMFENHIAGCRKCSAWYEIMKVIESDDRERENVVINPT